MDEFPRGRRYFDLEKLEELKDNTLRLVILEAAAGGAETVIPGLPIPMTGREIAPIPDGKPIDLIWESYIAYAVRNESSAAPEEAQTPLEDMLSERIGTAFLTFVEKSTWATTEFPGPYKHWELVCLNHVIDVASTEAPIIRSL